MIMLVGTGTVCGLFSSYFFFLSFVVVVSTTYRLVKKVPHMHASSSYSRVITRELILAVQLAMQAYSAKQTTRCATVCSVNLR